MTAGLENDIDISVPFSDLKLLQCHAFIACIGSGDGIELPTVPRTYHMQCVWVEAHAAIAATLVDDFFDLMNQQTIANRSALVRADIEVGAQLPLNPHHTDLTVVVRHQLTLALVNFVGWRDEYLSHICSTELVVGILKRINIRISNDLS
ncbi:hypothetical protein WT26_25445 [Burkholderia cepacia]|uniref:Uncharacterized protein n=2 Tax=Burkholderia cepacia complex TaxID=87882 RepID=A0A1B4PZD0_BURCE|nr:hypothetical protein WT26_25445 [Burkholderia cepacia]